MSVWILWGETIHTLTSGGFVSENLPEHRKRAVYKILQKHFAVATSVTVRELSTRRHVATWKSPRKKVRTWRFCLSWCRTGSNKQISSLSATVAKRVSKYLIHCSFGMCLTDLLLLQIRICINDLYLSSASDHSSDRNLRLLSWCRSSDRNSVCRMVILSLGR